MRTPTSSIQWSFNGLLAASLVLLAAGCASSGSKDSKPATATTTASPAPAALASAATPATPAPAARPAAGMLPIPVRIIAGSTSNVTDDAGNTWIGAGNFFADGETIERAGIPIANAGTKEAEIYRSERYSMTKFSYGPIPNGNYNVKLHFAETYDGITGAGQRVFGFDVVGHSYTNFDVWVKAPGFERAYVETVPVTVNNQKVDITFTAGTENPQINGIEILPR